MSTVLITGGRVLDPLGHHPDAEAPPQQGHRLDDGGGRLRELTDLPIIMLTAKVENDDKPI